MTDKRYMIHNTTRKPADLDESGNDNRTNLEKGGHAISFRDEDNKSRMIPAGGAPAFTSKLDQGLLSLQAEGAIRIEEFTDVASAMESHAIASGRGNHGRAGTAVESKQKNILLTNEGVTGVSGVSGAPGAASNPHSKEDDEGQKASGEEDEDSENSEATRKSRMAARERKGRDSQINAGGAKAVKTGEEDHTPHGGREHESAVNPDGEPNFLSKTKDVVRQGIKKATAPAKEGTAHHT